VNVVTVVEDGERLSAVFAEWLARCIAEHRASERCARPFSLAIPGGSVAERFLPRVRGPAFASVDLHVFWADERAVSADDPASNYGLARRVWLDASPIPADHVHSMVPGSRSLEEAARAAERDLLTLLGDPPELDVALLGVGEDGHVASLFPGHPVPHDNAWVHAVVASPKPPAERLTLTYSTLLRARAVAIGAFGAKKAPVIAEALSDAESQLPVARVLRGARRCFLFLDRAAAIER